VLVTNDDGATAAGLVALRAALLDLGLRVSVVAPDGNRSGMARAISFDRPVAVVPAGGSADAPVYACTGSPVDCVRVGLLSGLVGPVDLVVSGINHGLNVGDDTTYSGTVGAALEAAMLGTPAVAFSQQGDDGGFRFNDSVLTISFRQAARAATLALAVAHAPPPPRTALNVNFPSVDGSPPAVLTRPGRRYFTADVVKPASGPGEERAFFPYGLPADPAPRFDDGEGTDFAALQAGCISVSLLAAGAADEASAARRAWYDATLAERVAVGTVDASGAR
jgi:5'-nucleotidase